MTNTSTTSIIDDVVTAFNTKVIPTVEEKVIHPAVQSAVTSVVGNTSPESAMVSTGISDLISNAAVTASDNALTSGLTLVAVPISMLNGTLKTADEGLASLKAQLDAEVLAAQSKAKTTAALLVTTVKAAIADVEAWVGATPGHLLVVPPSQQTSTFLNDVNALKNTLLDDINFVKSNVSKDILDVKAMVKTDIKNVKDVETEVKSVWSKIKAWFKV